MRLLVMLLCCAAFAAGATTSGNQITFNRDVLPIVQKHCQECHRPDQIAPMPFLSYQETRPWAKAIKTAVLTGKMPPWFADPRYGHFSNVRQLTQGEIDTLAGWADKGAPEGDPNDKPSPRQFAPEGWNIKPDVVFAMPRAYDIPATATVEYTFIVIPTHFTEDTWVTAAEVLPGNRALVHHEIAYVRPPKSTWLKDAKPGEPYVPTVYKRDANGFQVGVESGGKEKFDILRNEFLAVYVPGIQPQTFVLGDSAKLIPAGSDIVLEVHYTPNGKPATDVTKVGLVLANHRPSHRYLTLSDSNVTFAIPPNDPNHEVRAEVTFDVEAKLVWLQPHMHFRGKDFEVRLIYPTGESEIALKVPHYSFLWQLGYDEQEPLLLPKGTRMECTAHFDNSPNNPQNPNPNVTVRFGDQSWEEMMEGWFSVVIDAAASPKQVFKKQSGAAE